MPLSACKYDTVTHFPWPGYRDAEDEYAATAGGSAKACSSVGVWEQVGSLRTRWLGTGWMRRLVDDGSCWLAVGYPRLGECC